MIGIDTGNWQSTTAKMNAASIDLIATASLAILRLPSGSTSENSSLASLGKSSPIKTTGRSCSNADSLMVNIYTPIWTGTSI